MSLKRVLVIGYGTLGQALERSAWVGRLEADFASRRAAGPAVALDITDERAVREFFAARPRYDLILNTAAMTDVDACERDPEAARSANAAAVKFLAAASAAQDASLIHISTNYVFAGTREGEYSEDDATGPCSAYGLTKLEGEWHALNGAGAPARAAVVRTSWVFGGAKRDFVRHFLEKFETPDPLPVVSDQTASLTYAKDLAEGLEPIALELEAARAAGKSLKRVYHATNAGRLTRYDMIVEMKKILRKSNEIRPVPAAGFGAWAAVRPKHSALSNARYAKAFGRALRPWPEALAEHLSEKGRAS